jgi:hypothetical protein
MRKLLLVFTILLYTYSGVWAQANEGDKNLQYTQVITKRADKIVAGLGITDSASYKKVLSIMVAQYRVVNDIHDEHNRKAKQIKETAGTDKAAAEPKIKALDDQTDAMLKTQHQQYMAKLGACLNATQIEQVKNGMTYNIMPITYKAYLDEIPTLTEPQKAMIKTWLTEARELAVDAESSEKKHAVFGKYKGRINNYLSAQGYDMKKEGEEWQKRIKARANP